MEERRFRMSSVTQRIRREIKQPRGGYINPKTLTVVDTPSYAPLRPQEEETVHASVVGMAVDYLTRFMLGDSAAKAFEVSLAGAQLIDEEGKARSLIEKVIGLDAASVNAACQLTAYDSIVRGNPHAFVPPEYINADKTTAKNIATMVYRCLAFLEKEGPVVSTTLSFPGGYTSTITVGDGDFMTQDGIWDIKVSKNPPTKEHTLQVLVYWLMGLHSCDPLTTYHGVERIGIFNPRLGQEFFIGVDRIPKDVLRSVQLDVIGYSEDELLYV